ncbi:U3 small nucleolar RNA-associated protein 18, partial [Clarias magur]
MEGDSARAKAKRPRLEADGACVDAAREEQERSKHAQELRALGEEDGVDMTHRFRKDFIRSDAEAAMSKQRVHQRLKEQFQKAMGGVPTWAESTVKKSKRKGDDDDDDDEDNELMQRTGNYIAASETLPKGIIKMKKCLNANNANPGEGRLTSVQFHNSAQVILTAGLDHTISLFQVDGKTNPKIQSIHLENFPVNKARFSADGEQVVATGMRNKLFYIYDMMEGKIIPVPRVKGLNEQRVKEFEVSPDGQFLLLTGSSGFLHLMTMKTKEVVRSMKANGSVCAAAFNSDGSKIFTNSEDGEVFIWDVRSSKCVNRFGDDGCVTATSLAVSKDDRYLACGSQSGVVNIYSQKDCVNSSSPKPLKCVMNLLTAATSLRFNPTSEILAIGSRAEDEATRLVHIPSFSVFSNFPLFRKKTIYRPHCLDFSPHSGFYSIANDKGQALLFSETSLSDLENVMKNVSLTVKLNVTARREDEGVQYKCAAVLNLDIDRPVSESQPITITVHYKPIIIGPLFTNVSRAEGESLMMECSADGKPHPHYNWTLPNNTFISGSSISISSIRIKDQGQYTCTAHNSVGHITKTVTVRVTEVCSDPGITPASLLVEYGHPAKVNCSILSKPVTGYWLGWKSKSLHPRTDTETNVMWKVDSLTNWDEANNLTCYITMENDQCRSHVNLTIYKRPDSVTLTSAVWREGHQTELMCQIENVGPGHKLSVHWSRSNPKLNNTLTTLFSETSHLDLVNEMKNVSVTVKLNITARREDEGVQYKCAAVLNMDIGPVVSESQPITITVHYKPIIIGSLFTNISRAEGGSLMMECLAEGNPRPHYNWTLPNNTFVSGSSIHISSIRIKDQGQYTCTAHNSMGQVTRMVTVRVT